MKRLSIGFLLLGLVNLIGCASIPGEPEFHLKRDIFQGQPIWESNLFQQNNIDSSMSVERFAEAAPSATISPDTAPGLYELLRQVDGTNRMLIDNDPTVGESAMTTARAAPIATPLPEKISSNPLAKSFIISLAAAHYNSRLHKINAYRAQEFAAGRQTSLGSAGQTPYQITDDEKFTHETFLDLGAQFLKANSTAFQSPSDDLLATLKANHDALAAAAASRTAATTQPVDPSTITYGGLALQYFSAYYGGNFVDRDGGTLAKPTFGTTISDTTLSNAATVGLEAIFDYAVIKSSKLTPDKMIKAPIVYDTKNKKWLTAKGGAPSLANVFHIDTSNFTEVKNVIEGLKTDTSQPGMTSSKIQLVKLLGGAGGDAAAGLNGSILRLFGGVHIGVALGLGALGKVSIGDNNTLANLVEAACGTIATRSTELFTSNMLYNVTYTPGQANPTLLVMILEYLDSVQTQDPGASKSNGGNAASQ